MPKKYTPEQREEAFWLKVDKSGGPDACWPWTGGTNADGYGLFGGDRAHRVAWTLAHGPIPAGLHVLHDCDNPPCANPRAGHLKLGTHQQNMDDRGARNRTSRLCGEAGPRAVLTDEIVAASRREYGSSDVTCDELADRYGIAHSAMVSALNGDSWAHLAEPPVRKGKIIDRQRGAANRMARLDETAVRSIRARRASGESYRALGRAHGVSPETARRACLSLWRHVT